jgi:hypothetical protein
MQPSTANARKLDFLAALKQEYPGHCQTIQSQQSVIRIDDRNADDYYQGFCNIRLVLANPASDDFTLILENVPADEELRAVVVDMAGDLQTTRSGRTLTLSLNIMQATEVKELAKAIGKVVGRGGRYSDRNWKWIAPRTARSLNRLAKLLSDFNRGRIKSFKQN